MKKINNSKSCNYVNMNPESSIFIEKKQFLVQFFGKVLLPGFLNCATINMRIHQKKNGKSIR